MKLKVHMLGTEHGKTVQEERQSEKKKRENVTDQGERQKLGKRETGRPREICAQSDREGGRFSKKERK